MITKRLHLRPLRIDDSTMLQEMATDPAIRWNTEWKPPERINIHHMIEADRATWMNGNRYSFSMDKDGTCIGRAFLVRKKRQWYLGYFIHEHYRRQGLALEACHALLHFAENILKVTRVYASVFPANEASMRLLVKLGMRVHKKTFIALGVDGSSPVVVFTKTPPFSSMKEGVFLSGGPEVGHINIASPAACAST